MPLTQLLWMSLYKKKGRKLCFFKNCFFQLDFTIFLFTGTVFFSFVFFFPRKDLTSLTHSFQNFVFFFRLQKKNTPFILTRTNLKENFTEVIFTGNKKEYGTYGYSQIKNKTNLLDMYERLQLCRVQCLKSHFGGIDANHENNSTFNQIYITI